MSATAPNYNHTVTACFVGYITQTVLNPFALTGQPAILAYNPRRSRYATDMQKPRTRRGFIMVAPNGVDPLT